MLGFRYLGDSISSLLPELGAIVGQTFKIKVESWLLCVTVNIIAGLTRAQFTYLCTLLRETTPSCMVALASLFKYNT